MDPNFKMSILYFVICLHHICISLRQSNCRADCLKSVKILLIVSNSIWLSALRCGRSIKLESGNMNCKTGTCHDLENFTNQNNRLCCLRKQNYNPINIF